jgi:hypothetical protein
MVGVSAAVDLLETEHRAAVVVDLEQAGASVELGPEGGGGGH